MAANIETMFYTREKCWHGLGVRVEEAPASADALRLAGLDWTVRPEPMYIDIGGKKIVVPNTFANTRSSDDSVLGVVTGKYKIVQNEEAFSFTDALLGEGVKYETAGSLDNGKRVWVLARMPETEILGDKIEQYLVFTNSHDGKGSIRVACTPVRVVCQNTLNAALRTASRSWSTKHMGNIESKMAEAHRTLELASKYMGSLKDEAEKLAGTPFSMEKFTQFVETLLPLDKDATPRQEKNVLLLRDDLNIRYREAPDLGNIRGTKWGVLNAVSDFATHKAPGRLTDTYKEKLFASIIDGNSILDKAYEMLTA